MKKLFDSFLFQQRQKKICIYNNKFTIFILCSFTTALFLSLFFLGSKTILPALSENKLFKKTVQTVVFLPYFMSSVIVVGIFVSILAYRDGDKGLGMINLLLVKLNGIAWRVAHFAALFH